MTRHQPNTTIPDPAPIAAAPQAVLDHWFEDGLDKGWPSRNMTAHWFGGGPEQDAQITERFGALVKEAQAGGMSDWAATPLTRLALVIVIDQYSRNVFRGQAQAFAGDARAQQLVLQGLAQGIDEALPTVGRVFFYMPLMHAEDLTLQTECLARFQRLHASASPALQEKLQGNLDAAQEHLDIVARFGRFPHRNAVLGRISTPEETAFLENGPRFGQ
ncbi:MAG: DUF924 family protein [Burkholderiaceae bacterium]